MLMGRYDEGEERPPRPLYKGVTTACFQMEGKAPSHNECWNIILSGLARFADTALRSLKEIPSGLELVFGEETSASSTAASVLLKERWERDDVGVTGGWTLPAVAEKLLLNCVAKMSAAC